MMAGVCKVEGAGGAGICRAEVCQAVVRGMRNKGPIEARGVQPRRCSYTQLPLRGCCRDNSPEDILQASSDVVKSSSAAAGGCVELTNGVPAIY